MKRDGDSSTGLIAWTMHLLVLSVAVGGGVFTMLGVRDLRDASEKRGAELAEFQRLSRLAARAPARELDTLSRQLGRRIAGQSWYGHLDGVRPRVVRTAAGLRIRLTVAVDARGRLPAAKTGAETYDRPREGLGGGGAK